MRARRIVKEILKETCWTWAVFSTQSSFGIDERLHSMKAVHLAPMHKRGDTRVMLKQCVSLARSGIETNCIVADGEGDEIFNGVRVVDCGRPPDGKFSKRFVPLYRSARLARHEAPDVIHFHDGMFLPFAIVLALMGYRIVYDVHEDYPRQVLNLRFFRPAKRAASLLYTALEWLGSRAFTRIVAATLHIATRFPEQKTVTVQNFPLRDELAVPDPIPYASRPKRFVYIGGIARYRGIHEIVDAMIELDRTDAALELAGRFSPGSLHHETVQRPGWQYVNFHQWLNRAELAQLLLNARAGLVVLYPRDNYLLSYPVKLFEYMAAGLPVIASNFPLWRKIIEDARCGLPVDPFDPKAIAQAMRWILDHPDEAAAMGQRGRKAVDEIYNWDREAEKLIACYRTLERR